VNETEAATVRLIFTRYLVLGCVSKLRADLERSGVRSKRRILSGGGVQGGCAFGRGALYHLLRNRIYRGEVVHKGIVHPGEHQAIVDEGFWNAVQEKLSGNIRMGRRRRIETGALLMGLIFDEHGNRMSPTYTVRRGHWYRYYKCQAALRGRDQQAGSRTCVGADDVETLVVETLARALPGTVGNLTAETRTGVRDAVERVVVRGNAIEIAIKGGAGQGSSGDGEGNASQTVLKASLPAPRPRARKEILVPGGTRSGPRHVDQPLVLALARARSWMRALRAGDSTDTAEIAQRSGLSHPHVRRLLRFAYLAPDLVEAIVEGRQPRTLTVKRLLRGIPLAWSDQRSEFGFGR